MQIKGEIERLCEENHLTEATKRAFANYGDIFVVDSIEEAIAAVNEIAPEHAEILLEDYEECLVKLINAEGMFAHALAVEVRK